MKTRPSRLENHQTAQPYRLRALGGLALEARSGLAEGPATRPRALALLAILAADGQTGASRDKLLLLLWPESNTQRARNSLHQTLYSVRRHLGQEAILARGGALRLNPAFFSCDVWDFEDALERDQLEEAIAIYGGPFLDGFAIHGLPEFERWIEEERARLALRYADAVEASAARATREGHHRLAIERWQVLAGLDPLSVRPALGLMRAFAAAGNRASALEHALRYQERVRAELGTEPDPGVAALAEQVRGRSSAEAAAMVVAMSDAPGQSAPGEPATGAAAPAAQAPARRRLSGRVWKLAVVALVLLDLAAVGAWLWSRWGRAQPPARRDLVAVLPFSVEGGPDVQYLSTGLVDLLSTNLEGAGEFRSVEPHVLLGRLSQRPSVRTPREAEEIAAWFGAGLYVTGNVVESGGRLHLRAAMYDRERAGEPIARAAVQGPSSELFGLVDQLTADLLAQGYGGPRGRLVRVAAATTGSLDALKSYLTGEHELRAGRSVSAMEAFRSATAADTGFSLAYYRMSIAAEWAGQDSVARRAAAAAARFGDRLSPHDRLLVRALAARREGRFAESERLYRAVVDDHPDDVEAWLQLGQLQFQYNPLRGRSAVEARPALERALELDPENEEALVHLARVAAIEGRRERMDTLMRRLLDLGSEVEVLETRAFRAFALGDRDAWKRVTRELLRDPPDVPAVTALEVATYLDDLEGAERFALLLRDPRYSRDVRGTAYRLLARVAAARGQWTAARAQLDTAGTLDPVAALELRSLLAALPFLQVPRAELLAIRQDLEHWRAEPEAPAEAAHSAAHVGLHPYVRLYRLGLLDVRLGDTTLAVRHARRLERAADSADGLKAGALTAFAHSLRARVADEGGRPAEALDHLEQADWVLAESVFEAEALDRFYRAELLHRLGRHDDALAWYRTIAERATYELVYLAAARWRQGQVYEARGDRHRAVESYDAVARLWQEADPPLRAIAEEVGTRIRALRGAGAGAGEPHPRPDGPARAGG